MEHEAEKEEVKKQDVYDKSTTNYVYPFKRNSSVHRVVWKKDLENATWTAETEGNYRGKMIFQHIKIRLLEWNKPLNVLWSTSILP